MTDGDDKALIAALDALPLAELQGISEKMFDAEGDAERAPKFGSRFIVAKILNDSQLFEIQDKKVDKIRGVLVEFQLTKTWYEKSLAETGGGQKPDCWSVDSISPHRNVPPAMRQNDKCATCKKNVFYDDPDPKRQGKKKKDCRDTLTMYLWHPQYELPILLRASTMNRKPISLFLKALAEKGIAKEMLVVEFSLFKDTQTADVPFSGLKIVPFKPISYVQEFYGANGENLTLEQVAQRIKEFKESFAEIIDAEGATVGDEAEEKPAAPPVSTPKANAAAVKDVAATKPPVTAPVVKPPATTPPKTTPVATTEAGEPPF